MVNGDRLDDRVHNVARGPKNPQLGNWLLILGAGASLAPPARLPAFAEMAEGVLTAIGWRPIRNGRWIERWVHERYPDFPAPAMAPEVLFGTLRSFGVEFSRPVAETLQRRDPNAAHRIAAQVLQAEGCVWTPNVDLDIEAACTELNIDPPIAGVAADRFPNLLSPLNNVAPGTLIKFHGTAEDSGSLAFTDRELIAPLPDDDIEHLVRVARDRDVVLFGYAGADADLAELLEAIFDVAGTVRWYEPSDGTRDLIRRAFPGSKLTFEPLTLPGDWSSAVRSTAASLIGAATTDGAILVDDVVAEFLGVEDGPPAPSLDVRRPPGVTHARLVERFGPPASELAAYRAARHEDLRRFRIGALSGHVRWAIGRSLYNEGIVADIVGGLGAHTTLLRKVFPRRLRDYVITRYCALLLQRGHWQELLDFADWAILARKRTDGSPYPSDLYYRSQGHRYQFRPDLAALDAETAADALADARDPERLAGALYEVGCASLYRADFKKALSYSFQLRYRRGRYAIPRWQAWGAWLEATTCAYQLRPKDSLEPIEVGRARFTAEERSGPIADMRTSELLNARVWLALTGQFDESLLHDPGDDLLQSPRLKDDLDLILADLQIGLGDLGAAEQRLARVGASQSSPVAAALARLGQAELKRLTDTPAEAAEDFYDLANYAHDQGATWLRLQALVGLALCDDPRYKTAWRQLISDHHELVRNDPEQYIVGETRPRVLWLLTI